MVEVEEEVSRLHVYPFFLSPFSFFSPLFFNLFPFDTGLQNSFLALLPPR